ncbi:MAG: C45 family peptidase [Planctomycetaceae bacterium]|jgi:hypothetical protein|nr:C45 family peptidase [Planctomycetaceae bacterium]
MCLFSDLSGVDFSVPFFELSGTTYEIGYEYGFCDAENIRRVLSHYVDVSGWFGSSLVDVGSLVIDALEFWGIDGLAEFRGMSDGAGVPFESLIYHNLQKYAVGACTHFAGEFGGAGCFYHGANIDIPAFLILRDSLAFHFQRRLVNGGIPYIIPGVSGILLGIGGVNASGIWATSSMLVDVPQTKRVTGMFHGKIIGDLLGTCSNIDEALRFLLKVKGWGGWSVAVSAPAEKRVIYAEYHGDKVMIDTKSNRFICSNHSQLFPTEGKNIPVHSRLRYERLKELLFCNDNSTLPELALFDKFNPLKKNESKFRTMNTVFRTDHAVSILADNSGKYQFALSKDAEMKVWKTMRNVIE